jgi:alanine-glyoxylate transaminase / serine-glyoxylate transaminase / serine-pyruvate transaminase
LYSFSTQALETRKSAKMLRKYFDWDWQLGQNASGGVPYTPSIPLLFGLRESLNLLTDEGIAQVVARHQR